MWTLADRGSRPFAERPEPRGVLVVGLVEDGQDMAVPFGIDPGQAGSRDRRDDPINSGQHEEGSAKK